MKLKNFFIGRAAVFFALIVIGLLFYGLYSLNAYLYARAPEPVFPAQGSEQPGGIVAENPEGEADPSRMKLDMQPWTWISATYSDGKELKPTAEKPFTLTFNKDGTFSARTDCNSIGGQYKVSGQEISFSEVFMTEMYCQGSQDVAFARMLDQISSYYFTNRGQLIFDFKMDSGSAVFR